MDLVSIELQPVYVEFESLQDFAPLPNSRDVFLQFVAIWAIIILNTGLSSRPVFQTRGSSWDLCYSGPCGAWTLDSWSISLKLLRNLAPPHLRGASCKPKSVSSARENNRCRWSAWAPRGNARVPQGLSSSADSRLPGSSHIFS